MSEENVLIEAILAVLKAKDYSLKRISDGVPRGFWKLAFAAAVQPKTPYFKNNEAMSNYFNKSSNKERILARLEDNYSENTADTTPKSTERPTEPVYYSAPTYQFTETDIRRIVQDELSKQKDSVMSIHTGITELVPEADTEAKQRREYHRLSVTVDKALWKLFREEQKSLNTTSPRLIDSILWAHFGRPKLSFEK